MLPRTFAFVIAAALATMTAGCDEPITNHPTGPNSTTPAVNGVEIGGPATLAPGQSARFTVSIRLADGSLKTAEPNAIQRWRIGNPSLLQADHFGIMTAQPRAGETTVSVDVRVGTALRTATREVVILPEGTFRVVGRIAETGFPTQGVGGAKVEVAGSEISTTSDFLGQYRLYGVPASAVIRVTASGYAPLEEAVSLTTHTTRNFPLDLDGIRPTVSGPYTLAIDVVSSCPNGPITDLQHRRYDAFLTANGPNIDVELTEPRFRLNSLGRGNKFTGRTIGNGVIFTLRPYVISGYYYYYYVGPTSYPDMAERLSDNSFLVIEGQAATNLTGSTLSGLLTGSLTNWDRRFPGLQNRLSSCEGSHQFVLSPR